MTEIALTEDVIEVLPARRAAPAQALGQLREQVEALGYARQWAEVLADPKNELCPALYRGKTGNAVAAILFGAELGLNPTQSLQQVFVVHGMPAIYARTAVALVKGVGIIVQTVSTSNDSVTVSATDPNTGQVEVSTWDMARAEVAGYTSNKKYKTEPQQMLYAKAAMEVCRKIAPDVLLGIPYSREELDLEQQAPRKVASSRRGVDGLRSAIAPPQTVDAPPAERPSGAPKPAKAAGAGALSAAARTKWERSMFAALNDAGVKQDTDQLVVITMLAGRHFGDMPEHRNGITDDELRQVVGTLGDWKKSGDLDDRISTILREYNDATGGDVADAEQMAGQEELDKLGQIRSMERYEDDESWYAYVQAATGALVAADSDLTLAQARALIDLFNDEAAK